jgi:hypothetical protein
LRKALKRLSGNILLLPASTLSISQVARKNAGLLTNPFGCRNNLNEYSCIAPDYAVYGLCNHGVAKFTGIGGQVIPVRSHHPAEILAKGSQNIIMFIAKIDHRVRRCVIGKFL